MGGLQVLSTDPSLTPPVMSTTVRSMEGSGQKPRNSSPKNKVRAAGEGSKEPGERDMLPTRRVIPKDVHTGPPITETRVGTGCGLGLCDATASSMGARPSPWVGSWAA